MEFKDRTRQLREEKGLSPSKLGAEMDKSEGAVRSWEIGKAYPDVSTLIKLAEFFSCTTDYLLGISDFKNDFEKKTYQDFLEYVNGALLLFDDVLRSEVTELIGLIIAYAYLKNKENVISNEAWKEYKNVMDSVQNMISVYIAHKRGSDKANYNDGEYKIDMVNCFLSIARQAETLFTELTDIHFEHTKDKDADPHA